MYICHKVMMKNILSRLMMIAGGRKTMNFELLRDLFLKRLTEDSEDNHSIFDAEEGFARYNGTDLEMILEKFDLAIRDYEDLRQGEEIYLNALREIDTHIRSTSEPVKYIIETLLKTLPEYQK